MKQHRIIKFEMGRRANCSSYNYVYVPIVTTAIYLGFFLITIGVNAFTARKMKNEQDAVGVWVGVNLIAIIALTVLAISTGMMDYGSAICIFPIAGIPLLLMAAGIPLVRRFWRAGHAQPPGDWDEREPATSVEQPAAGGDVETEPGPARETNDDW